MSRPGGGDKDAGSASTRAQKEATPRPRKMAQEVRERNALTPTAWMKTEHASPRARSIQPMDAKCVPKGHLSQATVTATMEMPARKTIPAWMEHVSGTQWSATSRARVRLGSATQWKDVSIPLKRVEEEEMPAEAIRARDWMLSGSIVV